MEVEKHKGKGTVIQSFDVKVNQCLKSGWCRRGEGEGSGGLLEIDPLLLFCGI